MITTIRNKLRKARRKAVQICRRLHFTPPLSPLRIAWIRQTVMMHSPITIPGITPAMKIAAIETEPHATA